MGFKIVILWTDALIYLLVLSLLIFFLWARKKQHLREAWRRVLKNRLAMVSLVILSLYVAVGLLDSIHYQPTLKTYGMTNKVQFATQTKSVFDKLISPLGLHYEKTYSAPFALRLYVKETVTDSSGTVQRIYPQLNYAGIGIKNNQQRNVDIVKRVISASGLGVILWLILSASVAFIYSVRHQVRFSASIQQIFSDKTDIPLRLFLLSCLALLLFICICFHLSANYHIFGTGKVGQDIFYQTLKSIRTGLVIGTLTTLVMLPFAILLGIMAGYFGGWIDDIIQYVYTTLSSIPGVLLIAAAILSLHIFISNHSQWFHTLDERADARLLALCIILGVTSWTGLCRMLRAETMKVREVDYIKAARALGSSRSKIIVQHILPNVMHIVLIAVVLDFSVLVLAEAVLSYVGVGVAPTTISWGNMINSARLELAREPIVWWPILAAFIFMFMLVLPANLFSDAVRDAFDPRLRNAQ